MRPPFELNLLRCQDRATDLPRPPSSPTTELSNGIEPSVGVNPHSGNLTPTGNTEHWSKSPTWEFTPTEILKLLLNNGASPAVHVTADANARLGPYLLGRGSRDAGINRRFEGGTTMEQVATVPLAQQNAKASLEQAAERIRALLLDDESDPWELGDLLNSIAKRDLARQAGYRSIRAWLFAKVPEAEAKDAALYRCAHVASLFSKEQAKLWGVIKLDALTTHDYQTRRPPDSEDPAEREIQLLQADGSTLTKKFRDCSCRELQFSNQLRRKTARDERQAATPRPKKEARAARSRPEIEVRSSRKPFGGTPAGNPDDLHFRVPASLSPGDVGVGVWNRFSPDRHRDPGLARRSFSRTSEWRSAERTALEEMPDIEASGDGFNGRTLFCLPDFGETAPRAHAPVARHSPRRGGNRTAPCWSRQTRPPVIIVTYKSPYMSNMKIYTAS